MLIKNYLEVHSEEVDNQISKIFFENSNKKNFDSEPERASFLYKYLGYYLEYAPKLVFLAMNGDEVTGYICGVPDSSSHRFLFDLVSHYETFADEYNNYPAHLHINLKKACQGMGLGTKLIDRFSEEVNSNAKGVHIITAPNALNVKFYKKNNFSYTKELNGMLLMGKELN